MTRARIIPFRSRGFYCLLIVATVIAGLAVRFLPLGLPPVVSKYGGSMLWALMIDWTVLALLPALRVPAAAMLAAGLATAVEFLKLYHSPGLDAFRLTIPGILLLGRFFSVWDIVAYWVAILIAAVLCQSYARRPRQS